MKIAFLLYHWPVITETFVMNQLTGLLDRGHEVVTFAKTPGKAQVIHGNIAKYDLLARTVYYGTASDRIPSNKLVRVVKALGLIGKHLFQKPLPVLNSLNVFKFGREAFSLGLFLKTAPFLGADKYDIVHCHFGPNGNLAVQLRDIGAIKGKIVTTFHGEAGYTGSLRYNKGFKPVFEKGDLLMPMSEREKQNLIKLGCNPDKIVVHKMGVDLDTFPFAPRQLRADGQVRLFTVGRLVEKKGVEYAIKAVAKVLERHPQIQYKIAGDGPLMSDLVHLVDALQVGHKVQILGWRPQEEIIELFKEADIFLAPSVNSKDGDQEGIPVVLMEALAQGLPVISTYHSGIPELVQDGVAGFLVPERDADALAEKLAYLVEHPELWAQMGQAGRDFVERHHDINTLNDQLVTIYQRLLDNDL